MTNRRQFLRNAGVTAAALGAGLVSKAALAALPESPTMIGAAMQPPAEPTSGQWYNPVVTLNGWSLPWRMKNGWKEFHLTAEAVEREISPGMTARLWGYNGQSPGPTIEAVEGDKVRIFVTNRLPEHTTIHWHGIFLPAGMDGVGGLNQPQIPPGKTYVYEFELKQSGTFMYHPHADEMVQMAMGMMGSLVVHPKNPELHRVDRDFCFLMNAYDIEPGTMTARTNTMLDFNLWTWNSRAFPGIDHLVVGLDEKVRVRMGNLTMTNHPIHIHGLKFEVAGTDGGWVPEGARWPEVTSDVAIGQMRAIEFIADAPGDWAMHCHKSHHTMNPMGHNVPNMIGVDQRPVQESLSKLLPGYMVMGERGMADMGEMVMPLPANTLPMMTGEGPFGPIEMGGMFTVLKVRDGQKPGDYSDPGWYDYPEGTVCYEADLS
ncbi:MAG: FtsP/CotA-like multicopper oxidase with cupredoxin domain [Saprospiraceae bacterium]|jgi:FtsP/CotA-like multicopper oxidase with cupredoxin domain